MLLKTERVFTTLPYHGKYPRAPWSQSDGLLFQWKYRSRLRSDPEVMAFELVHTLRTCPLEFTKLRATYLCAELHVKSLYHGHSPQKNSVARPNVG